VTRATLYPKTPAVLEIRKPRSVPSFLGPRSLGGDRRFRRRRRENRRVASRHQREADCCSGGKRPHSERQSIDLKAKDNWRQQQPRVPILLPPLEGSPSSHHPIRGGLKDPPNCETRPGVGSGSGLTAVPSAKTLPSSQVQLSPPLAVALRVARAASDCHVNARAKHTSGEASRKKRCYVWPQEMAEELSRSIRRSA
jgi:hypothetical protein